TPVPHAARLRRIMTSEKRYVPMATAIRSCIAQTLRSKIFRVLVLQIKNGYPNSSGQIRFPASRNRYFHVTRISGLMALNGGRISERHTFEPSHQPRPKHFVRPLKKYMIHKWS